METEGTKSPYSGLADKIRGGKSASTKDLENRPPELTIKRGYDGQSGRGLFMKAVLAYRNSIAASTFVVLVDDFEVGRLKENDAIKVQVAPGVRRVRIYTSMTASNEICLEFSNGDRKTLQCRTKMSGIILFQ